jgi:hypothetical protein
MLVLPQRTRLLGLQSAPNDLPAWFVDTDLLDNCLQNTIMWLHQKQENSLVAYGKQSHNDYNTKFIMKRSPTTWLQGYVDMKWSHSVKCITIGSNLKQNGSQICRVLSRPIMAFSGLWLSVFRPVWLSWTSATSHCCTVTCTPYVARHATFVICTWLTPRDTMTTLIDGSMLIVKAATCYCRVICHK